LAPVVLGRGSSCTPSRRALRSDPELDCRCVLELELELVPRHEFLPATVMRRRVGGRSSPAPMREQRVSTFLGSTSHDRLGIGLPDSEMGSEPRQPPGPPLLLDDELRVELAEPVVRAAPRGPQPFPPERGKLRWEHSSCRAKRARVRN